MPLGFPTRQALPNRIVPLHRQLLDRVPHDAGIGARQCLVDIVDDQESANDLHALLRHPVQYPACQPMTRLRYVMSPGDQAPDFELPSDEDHAVADTYGVWV